jgi:sigma-B regulation protein RsbU (phosphoserine phosphatase)
MDYVQGPRRFPERQVSIIEGIAHQTAIAIESARLYQRGLEQERIAEELRLAREIQMSFLPERCPSLRGWQIVADWQAARGVGGDFYDFIPLGRDRLGLVIADVSDKGVPAALFMSLSRTLVRATAAEAKSPARTLQRVNQLLMSETRSGMFVTVFYGVLDARYGRFTYANAGHNSPMLWRCATSDVITLEGHGVVLGVVEDPPLEERQVTIEPGDILILYTDGVTEPINELEEEFGEDRLEQIVAGASHRPGNEIVALIHSAVAAFCGDQPLFDDYTLVAVKRDEALP